MIGLLSITGLTILVAVPLSFQVNNAMKYSYCNARARAMKAHVITSKRAQDFVDFGIAEIMSDLEGTKGFEDLAVRIGNEFTVENFHKVLNERSYELSVRLIKTAPFSDRKFVEHLVRRVDYQNLKVLLRLKESKKSVQELLVPTQTFPQKDMDELMSCSLDELKVKLRFTFFRQLAEEKFDVSKPKQFESALDKEYFETLRHRAHHVKNQNARALVQRLIDVHNATMLNSFEKEDELVAGGKIAPSALWEFRNKGKLEGFDAKNAQELRIELERDLRTFGESLFLKDPLSLNSALGYLVLKDVMMTNLKRLLKLKAAKVKAEEIRKVIV